ncbi:transposase [Escherichia coli]|uniref:transposase n=1 Tax=Escherichia coli TaxID=562 RepID=UPI0018187E31|nr:transposase [Escherichia coli]EER9278459.1 transposase [Escherichia coli]EEZ1147709.1 transposase [Escherichia coli]EFD4216699.1 transposase [Escherichia coli]EFL6054531.1 transposase [Escherichia coli]MCX8416289.1 transposase [Escherichia coli]
MTDIELTGKSITLTDKYGSSVHQNIVLTYLMELYQMDFAELSEAVSTHYPSHKGVIMTIAEQLEERGLKKGLEKGRAEERSRLVLMMRQRGKSLEEIKDFLDLTDEQLLQALDYVPVQRNGALNQD